MARIVQRVIEREEKTDSLPPSNPGGQTRGESRPLLSRPASSAATYEIPDASESVRPGPALDPRARMRLSNLAKWMFLGGILLFVAWAPASVSVSGASKGLHYLLAVASAVVFGAVLATGLPRTLAPKLFGRWREATDAFRDWTLISLITGLLYGMAIQIIKATAAKTSKLYNPVQTANPELFDANWLAYRLPLVLICAVIGILIARAVSLRREGVLDTNPVSAFAQILIQALLVGLLNRPFEFGFHSLSQNPGAAPLMLGGAILSSVAALGIIFWSYSADSRLIALHKQRHPDWSGVDAGAGLVPLTLTVIGGRDSGKTVLLAAAFYEWSTKNMGNLHITPSPRVSSGKMMEVGGGASQAGTNLESIAQELYGNYEFPAGSVVSTSLDFDLSLGQDPVARFNILDYPGGAMSGRVADMRVLNEFWGRVENSDGLILIADMSYARRNQKDPDYMQVYNAYRQAMQRVAHSNGKNRVVPVALVLTKCDEWADPNTGMIDIDGLEAALHDFGYRDLEEYWSQLCVNTGPGVGEFKIFMTTAISYSEPQVDENGEYDQTKPFRLTPPPPQIEPRGCASPLLWMSAKVMRWNVTMFRDISSFFLGSSPQMRRRIEAIEEMERIAEEHAASG